MRYLLLSSFLVIIFSCAESPYRNLQVSEGIPGCLDKFKPELTSVLYNTHVNVTGKHLSGLLIFKRMPDTTIRVVFSNEMGVKFFDFEYSKSGFKKIYCMKQLDRKIVIRALQKDLGLLIMDRLDLRASKILSSESELYYTFHKGKEDTYYITDKSCGKLIRIENASKNTRKIIVNLSDYKAGMPDSVYIAHQTFEFNISLKQIQKN